MAQRSPLARAWYQLLRGFSAGVVRTLFCLRTYRRERIPPNGPVLLLSNHESHLDPVLVGVASRRPLSYLAKRPLFRGPFGVLIRSVNAIPVDQDGVAIAGMREIIRRLKQGEATLVFPEGSRSEDGQMGALQPGFGVLVRRSGATIVPVGIAGAFEAWPRRRRLPRPGRVTVYVGRPIAPDQIDTFDQQQLRELVARRIQACVRIAESLRHTPKTPAGLSGGAAR
jgi:1-acyl-sn-glycerol-3-phosphate acyltransferase